MTISELVCIDRVFDDLLVADRAMKLAAATRADNRPAPFEAAGDPRRYWPTGATLRVRFLDGDPRLHRRVAAAAEAWTEEANLELAFGDDPAAELRVTVTRGESWSAVGTDALVTEAHPADRPTMSLNLSMGTQDRSLRRHVRHEFGHALGLVHEHQSPEGGIRWNRDEVYRAMAGPPNHWDRNQVDVNYFERYSRDHVKATRFDPESVMLYTVPRSWTVDGTSFPENADLSELDRAFVAAAYPGR